MLTIDKQIYKLPQSSLAELARNSVIQSGFEMEVKRHWLGQKWYLPGAAGNDINRVRRLLPFVQSRHADLGLQTNVPDIRLQYRHQTLLEELAMIRSKYPVQGHVPEGHGGVVQMPETIAAQAMGTRP